MLHASKGYASIPRGCPTSALARSNKKDGHKLTCSALPNTTGSQPPVTAAAAPLETSLQVGPLSNACFAVHATQKQHSDRFEHIPGNLGRRATGGGFPGGGGLGKGMRPKAGDRRC